MKTSKTYIATILLMLSANLQAEEIRNPYLPVRAAGMGGAFTAVANDEGALYTNPAGIARVRKNRSRDTFHISKFPNMIVGANAESYSFYQGFKTSQDKSVEGVVTEEEDFGTKPFYARAGIAPVMIFDAVRGTPAAVGLFSETTSKIVIDKETPDEARVEVVSDQGANLAIGYTNRSNRFNIGLQVRPTARYAYEAKIPSGDLLDKKTMQDHLQNESNKSTGLGADFGMMATLADFWYPTIGISVLNLPTGCQDDYLNPFTEKREKVCGNKFTGDIGNEDALSNVDPMDVRVGVSITTRITRKVNLRFALDAHNIHIPAGDMNYGLSGLETSKQLHAGTELFFGNPLLIPALSFRGGYSQGFATYGASLNFRYFTLDFASYGVDVSSTSTPSEDRRYLGALSFGF
jgi:hypothetical protein